MTGIQVGRRNGVCGGGVIVNEWHWHLACPAVIPCFDFDYMIINHPPLLYPVRIHYDIDDIPPTTSVVWQDQFWVFHRCICPATSAVLACRRCTNPLHVSLSLLYAPIYSGPPHIPPSLPPLHPKTRLNYISPAYSQHPRTSPASRPPLVPMLFLIYWIRLTLTRTPASHLEHRLYNDLSSSSSLLSVISWAELIHV